MAGWTRGASIGAAAAVAAERVRGGRTGPSAGRPPRRRGAARRVWTGLLFACLSGAAPGPGLVAQVSDSALVAEAQAAAAECAGAAARGDEPVAERAAARAEELAKAFGPAREADALVLRAQVLSRCRIPLASFLRKGSLLEESNRLLEAALARDSLHLGARYTLAMNHYHTPAFFGRADDAVREFERLLRDHGEQRHELVRDAYLRLGILYERAGRRADAVAVWRRGLERFPGYRPLEERVEAAAGGSGGARPGAERGPGTPGPGGAPASGGAPGAAASGGAASAPGTAGPRDAAGPSGAAGLYALPPIVVQASGYTLEDGRGATRLTKLDVYRTPGAAADLLQVLQTLPGATRVSDAGDLYVRGGDPAESPVRVDGVRLFDPAKFETLHGGLFGVLDPQVLRRAYFSSGGFSARYGDALSGVLDVETDGRPSAPGFGAGANLVGGSASARVPLGARSGAWAAARATETSALLALHGRSADYPSAPRALEAAGALSHAPRPGLELRASGLSESDRARAWARALGHEGAFEGRGETRLAALSAR